MPRRTTWLAALGLALWLGPLAPSPASDTPDAPAADSAVAAQQGPAAIPVTDIPERADTDERYAATVASLANAPDPARPLETRLDAITRSVRSKSQLFRNHDLRMVPVLRLESLERYWGFDARRFARLRDDLRAATTPYADAAADLAKRRADWEATRAASAGTGIAAALVSRIDAVIAQIDHAERLVSVPLAAQLQLGRRANALEAEIDAGQKAIAAAIDYGDGRLARFDAPPIWRLGLDRGDNESVLASARLGLSIEAGFLRQYGDANGAGQNIVGLLELLLLPFLLWLSYRSRKHAPTGTDIDGRADSLRVLRRPLSSWLLLSMLAVLALQPDAPLLLHQIAMLLALLPVLRLLPVEGRRLLGPWPYAATGLYLLNRLAFFLLGNDFLYRWSYFAITVLALLLTLWLLWRSRGMTSGWLHGHAGQAVHGAAWFGVAVLAVSAIANAVGNVSLSEMLTGGLIDSGYMALVLYAGVTVFTALLGLLIAQRSASRFRIIREYEVPVLRLCNRLLVVGAVIGWIAFTANRFRLYRPVYNTISSALAHEFNLGEITITLGNVLVFVISVLVAYWAAKTVRFLLKEEVLPKMALPRGLDNSISTLSYYALLLLGLLVALAAAGFKVGQLALMFGALGVGIGLGLQDVVRNFVSGLILMFERPMKPGDVVEISGTTGRVRDIGIRATSIKTFDGADVIVPNGTMLSEKLTNWTLLDLHRRVDVDVGVAYGSDPDQVLDLLLQTVRATPGVAAEPEASVLFTGFGASSLDFAIRGWTHDFDNWVNIRSAMASRIYAALTQAGIEIPYPQQDLHLRSVSEDIESALARRQPAPPSAARDKDPTPGDDS